LCRSTTIVAWLLVSTASQEPSHFQKAGQIFKHPKNEPGQKDEHQAFAGPNYDHRKASLLTSLLPLLSSLITSKAPSRASQQEGTKDQAFPGKEDLEIYVACLVQLSAFEDSPGSIWKNQSAMVHPTLSHPNDMSLADALERISNLGGKSNSILRSTALDALQHYGVEKAERQESV